MASRGLTIFFTSRAVPAGAALVLFCKEGGGASGVRGVQGLILG